MHGTGDVHGAVLAVLVGAGLSAVAAARATTVLTEGGTVREAEDAVVAVPAPAFEPIELVRRPAVGRARKTLERRTRVG